MTPTYEQHLAEIRKVHPELPEDKREALAQHRTETHEGHNNVLTVPQVPAAVIDTEAIGRIVKDALDAYKFKPVIVREPQEPKVVYVEKPFPAVEYKIHELIREVVVEKPTLQIERVEVEKQVLVLDPHTTVVDRPVIVEKPAPRDRYRLAFRVIVLVLLAGLLARTAHCQNDPVQAVQDPVKNLVGGGALPAQGGQSGKFLTTNGTAVSWGAATSTLSGASDYTTNLVTPLALKAPLASPTGTGTATWPKYSFPSDSVIIGNNGAGGSVTPATNMLNTVVGDHAGAALAPNLSVTCSGAFKAGTVNTLIGSSGWSITTGCLNTTVGADAGAGLSTGVSNTLLGVDAGQLGTANNYVTAAGQRAAASNTVDETTAVGFSAMESGTSGLHNSVFGAYALRANTTGGNNSIFGHSAAIAQPLTDSVVMGYEAGRNLRGGYHVAIGTSALRENGTSTSQDTQWMTAVGYVSLMAANYPAQQDTALGSYSGYWLTTGSADTCIGYGACGSTGTTFSNSTALGANVAITASNQVVIGDVSVTDAYFGSATAATVVHAKGLAGTAVHFASISTTNGSLQYCDDCTIANPCAGSGTGAFAKRLNGVSVCN